VPTAAGRSVVVGVADHGGWAILVSTAAVKGEPTVIDRRRVPLIEEGVPSQPYHHDTLTMKDDAAEQLLRRVRKSIAACAASAFEHLAADLSPQYRVKSITIRQPPLERLPATVREAHDSYYVQCRADGMLYHAAVCTAARDRDWKVVLHPRGEELASAADVLETSVQRLQQFMDDLKQTLKSPWTAEHRNAFAAAIVALSEQSRVRMRLERAS